MTEAVVCPVCGAASEVALRGLYDDRYGYPGNYSLLRCSSCHHGFLDAQFSPHELSALYTTYYPRSARSVDDFEVPVDERGWHGWLSGAKASAFRWVPPRVRVLDIGCGFGESVAYHATRGSDAVGIDADKNVERVAARYGLDLRAGLFHAADFESDSFDYVTLDQVIEHQQRPVEFLREVASVVKPGGAVVLTTPNSRSLPARICGRRWINWHVPYHLQHFTRRSLRALAAAASFEIVRMMTVTNPAWLRFQVVHLASVPPQGEPSAFWDEHRTSRARPTAAIRVTDALWRARVLQVVTRMCDAVGAGDNIVCVLRRPS